MPRKVSMMIHVIIYRLEDLLNKTVESKFDLPATSIVIHGKQKFENRGGDSKANTIESISQFK